MPLDTVWPMSAFFWLDTLKYHWLWHGRNKQKNKQLENFPVSLKQLLRSWGTKCYFLAAKATETCGLRTCGKQKWSVTTSSVGCAGTQKHRHDAYSKQYRTTSCHNPNHVEASTSQPSCSLFSSIRTASWKISKDMLLSIPRNSEFTIRLKSLKCSKEEQLGLVSCPYEAWDILNMKKAQMQIIDNPQLPCCYGKQNSISFPIKVLLGVQLVNEGDLPQSDTAAAWLVRIGTRTAWSCCQPKIFLLCK